MPKIDIRNLHMTVQGNMVSVSWENAAAERFHCWLAIDKNAYTEGRRHGVPASPYVIRQSAKGGHGQRFVSRIYKNLPLDPARPPSRRTTTKHLNAEAVTYRATVAEALRRAEAEGMYQAAIDALDAKEREGVDRANAAIETGVSTALKALRSELRERHADQSADGVTMFLAVASGDDLRALYWAIYRAETKPQ